MFLFAFQPFELLVRSNPAQPNGLQMREQVNSRLIANSPRRYRVPFVFRGLHACSLYVKGPEMDALTV
jgi:hypothetical protein